MAYKTIEEAFEAGRKKWPYHRIMVASSINGKGEPQHHPIAGMKEQEFRDYHIGEFTDTPTDPRVGDL